MPSSAFNRNISFILRIDNLGLAIARTLLPTRQKASSVAVVAQRTAHQLMTALNWYQTSPNAGPAITEIPARLLLKRWPGYY
jgi:hypothetical protein